jgi:hypothetical protein
VFSIENLDEWIEKGEIPGRCRFDGRVTEAGQRLSILVRNMTGKPAIFRAVMLGDQMIERRGWKGSLRGRLSAVGTTKEHSFVEVLVGSDTIRFPVSDGEVADLGMNLDRGVRVDIQVEPDFVPERRPTLASAASTSSEDIALADTDRAGS